MADASVPGEAFLATLPRLAGREARPFHAQTCKDRPEMAWSDGEVHLFHRDAEIGTYSRRHIGAAAATFEPFERNGRWYALYSSEYTCTRVMTLPDCRDIGGEPHDSGGFCPVDLYVPRYRSVTTRDPNGKVSTHWAFESAAETFKRYPDRTYDLGPWQSLDIGFAFGCRWAQPYEIQVFDLSRAADGVLARDGRFGDIEIPDHLPLVSVIRLSRHLPGPLEARILRLEQHDPGTGRRISQQE